MKDAFAPALSIVSFIALLHVLISLLVTVAQF